MSGIFIFTSADKNAQKHLNDSIKNPIDLNIIKSHLDKNEMDQLKAEDENFYAWGAIPGKKNNSTWSKLQAGDFILCVYNKTYHYISKCIGKHVSEKMAIDIWGTSNNEILDWNSVGETWSKMYFLSKPVKINRQLSDLDHFLSKRYFGFSTIGDNNLNKIKLEYGSINEFIKKEFDYSYSSRDVNLSPSIPIETSKEVHIRKNAAITGHKAELFFMDKAKNDWGWEVEDKTNDHGLGYDFICKDSDGDEFYVEIKGCKGNIDAIRLTENEWKVAKEKSSQYLLVIVYDLDTDPKTKRKIDPYNNFNNVAETKEVVSRTIHIKKKDLIKNLDN